MKYIHPFYIGLPNSILLVAAFLSSLFFSTSLTSVLFSSWILKILGILLILSVFILENMSHKVHKQAHAKAENVNKIVEIGIYKKIRHPIYLGWILLNIGAFIFIGNLSSLVIAIIFIFLWYLEAKQEEKFLEKKFKKYQDYEKRTGMFFPKL